jgi:hypothetical protein
VGQISVKLSQMFLPSVNSISFANLLKKFAEFFNIKRSNVSKKEKKKEGNFIIKLKIYIYIFKMN